jgi:hypothetical protein
MVCEPLMLAAGSGFTFTVAFTFPVRAALEQSGEPEVSVILNRVTSVLLVSALVVIVKFPLPVPVTDLLVVPSRYPMIQAEPLVLVVVTVNVVEEPEHTEVEPLMVAIGNGLTVIVVAEEFAGGQTPLCTTALYMVVTVMLV